MRLEEIIMIRLNFDVYPLVVGQLDKFIFSDYEIEGGKIQLEAYVESDAYDISDICWNSSDENIAVVEDGLVRAIRTGIADIAATLPNGEAACCRIQVIDNIGRLTAREFKLNTDKLCLAMGEGAALYPLILPIEHFGNGFLDDSCEWTSSDESVAVVDHRGRIYARSVGCATITAVTKDVKRSANCDVEVVFKKEKEIYLDPLEDMDGGSFNIINGEKFKLSLPKEMSEQPVCWRSLDEGIVRVSDDGTVYSNCTGNSQIWASFINGGRKVIYNISVEGCQQNDIDKISLSRETINLTVGEKTDLYAIVFPATVLEKKLDWISSDENVVRIVKQYINLSGLDEVILEAIGEGFADIYAILDDKKVNCHVKVSKDKAVISSIELENIFMENEAVLKISPIINGGKIASEDADILWLSENRRLLTVDKHAYIKAYRKGKVKLYAISEKSLDEQARLLYKKLADERCADISDLNLLLSSAVYGEALVEISEEHPSLYNFHAPKEAVTSESVLLLWNRKSIADIGGAASYKIYVNKQFLTETSSISYTVKNLMQESEYEFLVESVDKNGHVIASQSIKTKTCERESMILDVTKPPYNAVGNGIYIETNIIQQAINDCPACGEVLLPKGYVFVSGALFLKSNMSFRVDGILIGSINAKDYPPVVCRWEGYRKLKLTDENYNSTYPVFKENVYSYSSLINVGVYDEGVAGKISPYNTENVRICGNGMINGNGFSLSYNEGPCWFTLRKGLPIPQSPLRNQDVRGRAIAFYNTKHAYVSDVTVAYSPAWTIQAVFSENITFDNVKIISKADGRTGTTEGMHVLNGDGIDPDSSININIVNCYFTVGDDAVAIKSGRNREGVDLAKPSAYIRVTDCSCVDAKGCFAIGSETAGGIHDVLFQNLKIRNIMHFGLWIKSAPCRGGLIEDILFRDCEIDTTGGAFQIEYKHGGDEYPSPTYPFTRRVSYENIHISGENKFGIRIMGEAQSQICDVDLRDISFGDDFIAKKTPKFILEECENIRVENCQLPTGYQWEKE